MHSAAAKPDDERRRQTADGRKDAGPLPGSPFRSDPKSPSPSPVRVPRPEPRSESRARIRVPSLAFAAPAPTAPASARKSAATYATPQTAKRRCRHPRDVQETTVPRCTSMLLIAPAKRRSDDGCDRFRGNIRSRREQLHLPPLMRGGSDLTIAPPPRRASAARTWWSRSERGISIAVFRADDTPPRARASRNHPHRPLDVARLDEPPRRGIPYRHSPRARVICIQTRRRTNVSSSLCRPRNAPSADGQIGDPRDRPVCSAAPLRLGQLDFNLGWSSGAGTQEPE